MTDNGDDSITVVTGYFTMGADDADVDAIRDALQECGYAVDLDRDDGAITVRRDPVVEPRVEFRLAEEYQGLSGRELLEKLREEHGITGDETAVSGREQARQKLAQKVQAAKQGDGDYEPLGADEKDSDSSERSDKDDEIDKEMTKRERRIQRLENEVEEGEAYTSNELCAIAYDIDAAAAGTREQAYLSNLRANGYIDLQTMPDPNRSGNAKLYYRGEQPDVEVPDEQDDQGEQESDTADCQYCGEEYKKRGVRRHERACDENSDVETAWTVSRVETVMEGNGWMTVEEIALQVLDQAVTSPDERNRFHNLVSRKPDLKARITSRPDPANRQRNQYRLQDTEPDGDDGTESDSECGCPTNAAGEVQHEGDCPEGVEQEISEMQDLYADDEPARLESDTEPDEPVPTDTETGDDEDEDDEDSEDEFTCTACGQQFDTFHSLRDHHCDTGDFPCPECDKAFDDDEALQNHLRDKHPDFYGGDPATPAGTDEDADDDEEELRDEMGPCNIGKIMVQGEFERYVCQECHRTFSDESDADAHADDYNHPTFKAFDQMPDREKQPAGYVGGGTAR